MLHAVKANVGALHTGETGLEIAPGNEVEDLSLIADVGNAWNHIPQANEWTPLDPKCALPMPPAACLTLANCSMGPSSNGT